MLYSIFIAYMLEAIVGTKIKESKNNVRTPENSLVSLHDFAEHQLKVHSFTFLPLKKKFCSIKNFLK